MKTVEIIVNGTTLLAQASGALFWPDRSLLVVSDLHLEKGSRFAAEGVPLPPYDTAETLNRLASDIAHLNPDRVICLGDSFHDAGAGERMAQQDVDRLAGLVDARAWTWISGNHDPTPPTQFGGEVTDELVLGPLCFRHEARENRSDGEISGHYHPKARVRLRGRSQSGACFISDGRRLIMPAYGAYTGGLDVTSPEIKRLLAKRFEVVLLSPQGPRRVPVSSLK
ncbi:MAG: ligase-associated DNA damage response endonuclease PdeM [Rhodospirillaceae bacterium]|nr:ligase-associated DNA damage response endonuclease PdeM [Rhodospirillaceae bacterium]MBT6138741.1 ligase-associated DNA damage response endonuclease PdeM [Rhodospirillaceae bacterium]